MAKKEYIERNAVVNGLRNAIKKYSDDKSEANKITALIFQIFAKEFESIPAADVEPVRHGHWINENFYTRCSVCGKMAIYDKYGQEVESDFCPNCGAKMDGDKND